MPNEDGKLSKWERCCCGNLGVVWDYDCEQLLCKECWSKEEHSETSGYHYYIRNKINDVEEIPPLKELEA